MKKSLLTITIIFLTTLGINLSINNQTVKASRYCFNENYNFNVSLMSEADKETMKTCACNNAWENGYSCKQAQKSIMKDTYSKGDNSNQIVNAYKYSLSKIDDKSDTTKYSQKMNELLDFIEGIINAAVGVIIFILGFGFLYNVTQMGIASSNPQQRMMCLKRMGEVFGTAFFIGCIPLIMQLLIGIIGLL